MAAAIGLGNMIVGGFAISILYGLNGSVETLVSQANGAGNQYMCGVYLKTGRFVVVLASIPIALIFSGLISLLKMANFNPEISEMAEEYLVFNGLGILFFGLFDIQRRFVT